MRFRRHDRRPSTLSIGVSQTIAPAGNFSSVSRAERAVPRRSGRRSRPGRPAAPAPARDLDAVLAHAEERRVRGRIARHVIGAQRQTLVDAPQCGPERIVELSACLWPSRTANQTETAAGAPDFRSAPACARQRYLYTATRRCPYRTIQREAPCRFALAALLCRASAVARAARRHRPTRTDRRRPVPAWKSPPIRRSRRTEETVSLLAPHQLDIADRPRARFRRCGRSASPAARRCRWSPARFARPGALVAHDGNKLATYISSADDKAGARLYITLDEDRCDRAHPRPASHAVGIAWSPDGLTHRLFDVRTRRRPAPRQVAGGQTGRRQSGPVRCRSSNKMVYRTDGAATKRAQNRSSGSPPRRHCRYSSPSAPSMPAGGCRGRATGAAMLFS